MKGVRRTRTGNWQVYVRVHGEYLSRTLPPDATPRELAEARERLIAEAKYGAPPIHGESTFRQDAAEYLRLVEAMPTYSDREYRINCWVEVFGSRVRSTLTARDIRAQLERWRLTGRADGGPLTNGSLNQRRVALMHLFTVLDGKSAPNVVKDVPAYDERYSQQVRAESMLTCARLIKRLRPGGKIRAVLHALLWTGWPHALLAELRPSDVDWDAGKVRVTRRIKGKGMPPAWIPVVPRAIIALRQLDKVGAWGGIRSNSSMHTALSRAIVKENRWREKKGWPLVRQPFGPYSLRHSFATWAAARIKDDRALKELLRTNSIHRYTEGALAERLQSARDVLAPKRPKVLVFKRA